MFLLITPPIVDCLLGRVTNYDSMIAQLRDGRLNPRRINCLLEAKSIEPADFKGGLSQLAVEMCVAATFSLYVVCFALFKIAFFLIPNSGEAIFGAVTNGLSWVFTYLKKKQLRVSPCFHISKELPTILQYLITIINHTCTSSSYSPPEPPASPLRPVQSLAERFDAAAATLPSVARVDFFPVACADDLYPEDPAFVDLPDHTGSSTISAASTDPAYVAPTASTFPTYMAPAKKNNKADVWGSPVTLVKQESVQQFQLFPLFVAQTVQWRINPPVAIPTKMSNWCLLN